jgi:N-acetyl-anhydromuramyl-L-alanine amidase AmpD
MATKTSKKPATAAATSAADNDAHGSSNQHLKPAIKKFIESPNHSSRNGARIDMIVVHCTEASLKSTLDTFTNPGGRQVSAHYVIDRNGDIYQMVRDTERANHCRGANQNSIGIEHVGTEEQALASAQAKASADLLRWLVEQYDIPRRRIFGHDFAPGALTDTSCPDKLFGPAHTQQAVADWVEENV